MHMTSTGQSGHFHAVKFYKDTDSLAQIVCTFLAEGLLAGEPAILVATQEHTERFRECFATKGIEVDAAIRAGTLTLLDADQMLGFFMRDGIPMAQAFKDTFLPILETIASRFPGRFIRAYGEMVDVLWKQDQTAAAVRLEMLWNDLARSHYFGLLCGYAMGSFYKGAATEEIAGLHSHVVTDTGARVSFS
jgi:hypothetical protein